MAQFLLKQYDDALESLNTAIELAPDSALLVANRARIFAIKGNYSKALDELGKALQLEPRSLPVLLLRARIYQQAKDMKHAMADVNEVLRIRPGYPEGLASPCLTGRRQRQARRGDRRPGRVERPGAEQYGAASATGHVLFGRQAAAAGHRNLYPDSGRRLPKLAGPSRPGRRLSEPGQASRSPERL